MTSIFLILLLLTIQFNFLIQNNFIQSFGLNFFIVLNLKICLAIHIRVNYLVLILLVFLRKENKLDIKKT